MIDLKFILLSGLIEPRYSRVEFWQIKQKESGFSPIVFWLKLNETWQEYSDRIYGTIKFLRLEGNDVDDSRLPLFTETLGRMSGHLGVQELDELFFSLYHYGIELKQDNWLYEYNDKMGKFKYSKKDCPSRVFNEQHQVNIQYFKDDLEIIKESKIEEFLSYHFDAYKNKNKDEIRLLEFCSDWIQQTKLLLPAGYNNKKKDIFLRWFENLDQSKKINIKSQIKDKKTRELSEFPQKFVDLFNNSNLVEPALDILKNLDPPLIDSKRNYIGKSKGAICLWVRELVKRDIMKHFSDRSVYANLIPQKIKGFSIDESMFGKSHKRAEKLYSIDIRSQVSRIKLSQDSQKGKLGKLGK